MTYINIELSAPADWQTCPVAIKKKPWKRVTVIAPSQLSSVGAGIDVISVLAVGIVTVTAVVVVTASVAWSYNRGTRTFLNR